MSPATPAAAVKANPAAPATPIRLYHHPLSGHAYRVQLFLALLGLPVELKTVDLVAGEHKQAAFLALNPFGQVPVIEDGELCLPDSAAILVYLARRYDAGGHWLPADAVGAARVQRWLSVAAGRLVNGPGALWVAKLFSRPVDDKALQTTRDLFTLMDAELARHTWLAGGAAPTIADIAMHSYTVLAPANGVTLDDYPNVLAWVARIEALPGFFRQSGAPALTKAA